MRSHLTRPFRELFQLLFPTHCCCCDRMLVGDEHDLCLTCLSHLPYTHDEVIPDNSTAQLFWGKFRFSNAMSLLVFQQGNATQKIVHQIKYYNQQHLAIVMGHMMGEALLRTKGFQSVDMLIPVPLHRRKERRRGYNQSELLCRGIAEVFAKDISKGNLIRTKNTESQTHKSPEERRENMKEVFHVKHPQALEGKHLLLIDDVATTGATITSCCHELLKIPGVKISIATLAKA